jgi:hypothetical protein
MHSILSLTIPAPTSRKLLAGGRDQAKKEVSSVVSGCNPLERPKTQPNTNISLHIIDHSPPPSQQPTLDLLFYPSQHRNMMVQLFFQIKQGGSSEQ